MFSNELVGYLAAFCTTASFVPQAFAVYKSQRTRDISLGMFSLMTLGLISWLTYGVLIFSLPVILANSVSLIFAFYILFKKIKDTFTDNV